MFGIKKKAARELDQELTPEHIQVRSYYGMAIHIKQGGPKTVIPALCGYDNWVETNTVIPVTAEDVNASVEQQHGGWFWCKDCAAALTGLSADSFPVTRK